MTSMHLVSFIVFTLVHVATTQSTPGDTRLVSSAQELGGALRNESVLNVIIKGKIRLSKENWVPGGTAFINNNRHVVLQSDQEAPASAVLDLGTLVDAIHVAAGSHLELRRLRIPNSGNRRLTRPSERVRLRVAGIFALWPSVTLAKDSQMSFSDSVFYYWSDKEWDSCDKFRDAATNILNPRGVPDMLEWSASDTQVYIRGSQNTSQALVNIINKKVHVGAFNTTRTNHTLVCLPDPFQDESSGSVSPLAVFGVLATLAAAVAIAQYFGLIRLLPAPAAPPHPYMMGSQSSGEAPTSVHGSATHYHSSAGSHPSRGAEEHISGLVRDRQRATIGGLELGEMLGRGSFGKVYKGRWRGAIVAVKIVAHDCSLASLAETLRESALSTSIQHPNVVTTFKVRTVRSTHGSNDPSSAAATWAQGEENGLDAASGDSGRLLMRAMSVGPGRGGRDQPLNRSSLTTMVSPLRNSALNTPEKLLSRADSGTGSMLEGVQEEDEEPEPLSMAIKDGRGGQLSHLTFDSTPDPEEPESLSLACKAGRSLPSTGTETAVNDGFGEPEPLSMAIKAGKPVTAREAETAAESDDEAEPLSMAIKSGARRVQALPQGTNDADDEPEPLTMAMKSGRSVPAHAAAASISNSKSVHLGMPLKDSANEMHDRAALQAAAAKAGRQQSDTREPEPLTVRAKSGVHVPVIRDADVAGEGGNTAAEEGDWEDNAEPLSMSYKAGIARPPRMPYTDLRNKGPSPDRPVMPPLPGGTEGSGGMSGAGLLQNRMASVAGQTMNRLFSFGRAQLFEGRKPEEAEEGTPRPAVPSALLTPTDSERGSAGGNPAAQMQQAAEKGADLLETWLILEFCDQGSFDHAIRAGRYTDNLPNGVLCLMDIAAGMEHLHSLGVLHADLKGANVLLKSAAVSNYDSRGYSCKLADFGLSRVMENNSTHVSTSTFGTAAYMPAELLMEGKMTRAADVYSFSMLMFELLIGAQLFEGMRQSQIICKVITGWRPSVPDDSHPSYVALMTDCWHVDMTQRPVFSDILQRLRALYRELRMAAG